MAANIILYCDPEPVTGQRKNKPHFLDFKGVTYFSKSNPPGLNEETKNPKKQKIKTISTLFVSHAYRAAKEENLHTARSSSHPINHHLSGRNCQASQQLV